MKVPCIKYHAATGAQTHSHCNLDYFFRLYKSCPPRIVIPYIRERCEFSPTLFTSWEIASLSHSCYGFRLELSKKPWAYNKIDADSLTSERPCMLTGSRTQTLSFLRIAFGLSSPKKKNLLNQMLLGVLDLFLSRSLAHPYNAHKDTRGIGGAPRPIEYFVDKMLDWIKRQSHLGLQQDKTRNDLF